MAILNSGFLVENPMDLTEPLEKLIKVGFGLARDEAVEEIEVELDEEEEDEDEEDGDIEEGDEEVEEVDLSALDDEIQEEIEEEVVYNNDEL